MARRAGRRRSRCEEEGRRGGCGYEEGEGWIGDAGMKKGKGRRRRMWIADKYFNIRDVPTRQEA